MPDDIRQPPRTRRPLSVGGRQDPPSGRWDAQAQLEYDDDPTPPPVDPDALTRWQRSRTRISELGMGLGTLVGRVGITEHAIADLARRVTGIEASGAEATRSIANIDRQLALQGQSVTQIERGVARMESARDSDGAKARHIIQIAAAFAALAVSIISIVTR